MTKKLYELSIYIIVLVISTIYYIECIGFTELNEKLVIIAVFWPLLLIDIYQIIKTIKNIILDNETIIKNINFKEIFKSKMLKILIILVFYMILIPLIGFFSASLIGYCLLATFLGSEPISIKRILITLSIAILFLGVAYFAFVILLKVRLPKGILF